jgi:hypothetical protein
MASKDSKQSKKSSTVTAQTVRIPRDVMTVLGHRLVDSGESFQGFVMRAIQGELNPAPRMGADGKPESPYVSKLKDILEGVDEIAKDAITRNIDFFWDRMERPKPPH